MNKMKYIKKNKVRKWCLKLKKNLKTL
jgi:hypothetical protein